MSVTLDQFKADVDRKVAEVTGRPLVVRNSCLWPAPYDQDTPEAAYGFLTECWYTLNEADQRIALVPAKSYIRWLCREWVEAFAARRPFILEKSRRQVVSWACRGLETWQMGKARGEWLIIDQTHSNAAEHLWRIDFALNQLYDRRRDLNVKRHDVRGAVAIKEPTHVILANGSIITQGHQDAGSAQGKGKTGVTLEEVSKYQSPAGFWAQSLIVTQGSAEEGSLGGWVCGIANPSTNSEWRKIKGNEVARQILGFE